MNPRNINLTEHFKLSEFVRPSDSLPETLILQNLNLLAQRLQVVRDIINRPIKITSGYRTPEHNKQVGGSSKSYHLRGMAADIVVLGTPAIEVQEFLKNWSGGMGSYGSFTHLDIGPKRRWKG